MSCSEQSNEDCIDVVTLDNRRLAVHKMARAPGKCRLIKVQILPIVEQVLAELKRKADTKDDGMSVQVRGRNKVIHADGNVTTGPEGPDFWCDRQWHSYMYCIEQVVDDFQSVKDETW